MRVRRSLTFNSCTWFGEIRSCFCLPLLPQLACNAVPFLQPRTTIILTISIELGFQWYWMSALQVHHRVLHTPRKWKEDSNRDPHPRNLLHRWGDRIALCCKCNIRWSQNEHFLGFSFVVLNSGKEQFDHEILNIFQISNVNMCVLKKN